jgi:saccharopine dehydrogenase-like NADP-dependent oxidoreductase
MHRILVLGAGMVAGPLVRHLLDAGCRLTVTSLALADAETLIAGHPQATPLVVDLADEDALDRLVADHDLTVSLVPYRFHPLVARCCLRHGRHLVTASYVAPEMQALDAEARAAGLAFLNEMGLDPGIDHMSAMRVIHDVQERGGVLTTFRSYCGGLPAPEATDNPLGYKFSWSPEGVLMASRNGATYLKDGRVVETAPERLFRDMQMLHVPGGGDFEAYPNRDSLAYREIYGLGDGLRNLMRGTLRNPGWCDTMFHLRAVGLLDVEPADCAGLTRGAYVRRLLGAADGEDIRTAAARRMGLCPEALPPSNLAWLGLGDETPLAGDSLSPLAVLGQAMQQKLVFAPGERDMIVLHHEFQAVFADEGREERITSSLVTCGEPGGPSAMARTVSLPAAIAAVAILDGRITGRGVLRPVHPEIYRPVLDELAGLGIVCTEETTTFAT